MTLGTCRNCGISDLNSSTIYTCPECGDVFHDTTWMYIDELLDAADPDEYPVSKPMRGCARRVTRQIGYKEFVEKTLDDNITSRESMTMVVEALQCPHCGNWATHGTQGLVGYDGNPEEHIMETRPDTDRVEVVFCATNPQNTLPAEYESDNDNSDLLSG